MTSFNATHWLTIPTIPTTATTTTINNQFNHWVQVTGGAAQTWATTPSTYATPSVYQAMLTQHQQQQIINAKQAAMQSQMQALINTQIQAPTFGSSLNRPPPRSTHRGIHGLDESCLELDDNWVGEIHLPDGAIVRGVRDRNNQLVLDVIDKDAKIRYRGATREFNRYINSSDLLEEFIAFCGDQGARSGDILGLPLELFITFLVIRSAQADGEEPPPGTQLVLPPPPKAHRCGGCGRFLATRLRAIGIGHCNGAHLDMQMRRLAFAG